jgi:hypothetical protein
MRRAALGIVAGFAVAIISMIGTVTAAEVPFITRFRVLDNGTFVRWDFVVCTPSRSDFEFEIEWFQAERHRVRDDFRPSAQGRNCGRYTLGLRKRRYFVMDTPVRTRVNVYLGGSRTLHSRYLRFTPTT